jgi:hypothetical protein
MDPVKTILTAIASSVVTLFVYKKVYPDNEITKDYLTKQSNIRTNTWINNILESEVNKNVIKDKLIEELSSPYINVFVDDSLFIVRDYPAIIYDIDDIYIRHDESKRKLKELFPDDSNTIIKQAENKLNKSTVELNVSRLYRSIK